MNANLKHGALEAVRQYYGEVLTSSDDLKTGACCATDCAPASDDAGGPAAVACC